MANSNAATRHALQQEAALPKRLGYMPELDGLRALAVGAVLFHHFVAEGMWGPAGVHLFFVISGFLITGIILNARDRQECQQAPWWHPARQFYIRRFLRIFPLYYFVLVVAVLANVPGTRQEAWWLFGYAYNVRAALTGQWTSHFSHFWSLAVEEQFYLLWPWVPLFAPRRWLQFVTLAMIAAGPIYRALAIASGANELAAAVLTPACLDSLGLGALLAVRNSGTNTQTWRPGKIFITTAVLLRLSHVVLPDMPSLLPLRWAYVSLAESMIFTWLVGKAAAGRLWPFFSRRFLVRTGKISYGIYVYHNFVPELLSTGIKAASLPAPLILIRLLSWPATFLIASVSWKYFEGPLNALKDRFRD